MPEQNPPGGATPSPAKPPTEDTSKAKPPPEGEVPGATIGQATTALDPRLQRTMSPTEERRVASMTEPEPRPRNLTEEQIEDTLFARLVSEGKSETDARTLAVRRAREMTLDESEAAERRPKRRTTDPTPVLRQRQPERTRGRREAPES